MKKKGTIKTGMEFREIFRIVINQKICVLVKIAVNSASGTFFVYLNVRYLLRPLFFAPLLVSSKSLPLKGLPASSSLSVRRRRRLQFHDGFNSSLSNQQFLLFLFPLSGFWYVWYLMMMIVVVDFGIPNHLSSVLALLLREEDSRKEGRKEGRQRKKVSDYPHLKILCRNRSLALPRKLQSYSAAQFRFCSEEKKIWFCLFQHDNLLPFLHDSASANGDVSKRL
jgi:hypothetical protein